MELVRGGLTLSARCCFTFSVVEQMGSHASNMSWCSHFGSFLQFLDFLESNVMTQVQAKFISTRSALYYVSCPSLGTRAVRGQEKFKTA